MKVLLRILLIVSLCLLFDISFADAQDKSGKKYIVNTSMLNVREEPSAEADTLGTLVQGNFVTVFQDRDGWSQTYFNGEKAWVASRFLLPTKEDSLKDSIISTNLLADYTIVVDPGHGGKDPGALGVNGVQEKDIILSTSKRLSEQLKKHGANVILTRNGDFFVSLDERVQISHSHNADAFVSIHYNAFALENVHGFNTYYYSLKHRRLAKSIHQSLSNAIPLRNRGIIRDDYRVLHKNKNPSVLIELGFITNSSELKTLQSEDHQATVVKAITDGLIEYFHH